MDQHVLKVRNIDLINIEYLWRFVSCGAMVLAPMGSVALTLSLLLFIQEMYIPVTTSQ